MSEPSKRRRSVASSSTNTTTTISDLCRSHSILSPNEYSSAAVGIHNCLVRWCELEHLAKSFYQGVMSDSTTEKFLQGLHEMEKKLKDDCQLDIERSAMIARLRKHLENDKVLLEDSLEKIKDHLVESMRVDSALPSPQSYDELAKQCSERDQAARERDLADRMRRFQFYDQNEINQPVNLISLKDRTQAHFQLLVTHMTPNSAMREESIGNLKSLLDHSFFIIQQPSPVIAKLNPPDRGASSAKLNCRPVCLLETPASEITIDDITPVVHCLSKSNQIERNNISYCQPAMNYKTYSLVTASDTFRTFTCAEMYKIVFDDSYAVLQKQIMPTAKMRHSPLVHYIEFHVKVTVHFPNDPEPFEHEVVVPSAPFGLITNTCQDKDLLPEVFLEDLKSWKWKTRSLSDTATTSSITTDLTIEEIVDSIRRYFIHKTGIHPKHWIMAYIQKELSAVYKDDQNFINTRFSNVLSRILAQIDYMVEHPLLIFFHNDGLFFALCDSELLNRALLRKKNQDGQAICAMRFGSIHRMSNAKDIGVRVDLLDKSSNLVQHCTFDAERMPLELGLFIIKIALCKTSNFESILTDFIAVSPESWRIFSKKMRVFVDLYDSDKLREICPHRSKYNSIWTTFHNKENKEPNDSIQSSISSLPQYFSMTTVADDNRNNTMPLNTETVGSNLHPWNPNICVVNQEEQAMQSPQPQYIHHQQYPPSWQPQAQYHLQQPPQVWTSDTNHSNMLPTTMASPYPFQNDEQYSTSSPIVIVITSDHQFSISNQDITQLISHHLPQYSPLIQPDHIHMFSVNSLPQLHNTDTQTPPSSLPDPQPTSSTPMIPETLLTDLMSLDDFYNKN